MSNNARLEDLRRAGATITTFADAKRAAKKAAGKAVYSDAGDGWVTEWTWCPQRKRVIAVSITPGGQRITS